MTEMKISSVLGKRFRPLIRGFFFYITVVKLNWKERRVSVPSFGDSFFILSL